MFLLGKTLIGFDFLLPWLRILYQNTRYHTVDGQQWEDDEEHRESVKKSTNSNKSSLLIAPGLATYGNLHNFFVILDPGKSYVESKIEG